MKQDDKASNSAWSDLLKEYDRLNALGVPTVKICRDLGIPRSSLYLELTKRAQEPDRYLNPTAPTKEDSNQRVDDSTSAMPSASAPKEK